VRRWGYDGIIESKGGFQGGVVAGSVAILYTFVSKIEGGHYASVWHVGQMTTPTDEVVLTLNATPEKDMEGKDVVIGWFTNNGYLDDFLQTVAIDGKGSMTYNKSTSRYEIRFSPNEYWPKNVKEQILKAALFLENPDTYGNYLVDGERMLSSIRSVNGEELYEWRDIKVGEHTKKYYVLKEEYDGECWAYRIKN
jgi:hypothetical protein